MFDVRRFVLPSGLRVLHAPDHAAPLVSFQTWFQVGSRDEQPGKTGMAHLFEHLMFNQTESMQPGEMDRLIEQTGGDTNAATWVDWTYYRSTVPARDLDLVMRLEADRMQHLVLEDEQLESERDVVTNERLERVEDDVEGFMDEELFRTAFTTHPYHWPTIGWMDDIRGLAKPDIHEFYAAYYAPNNATIVVAGDVTEDELRRLLDRHYGRIPRTEMVTRTEIVEPPQTSERRRVFAKPVPADRAVFAYKTPGQAHPDWAVLEFICTLLAGGPSAGLYRRLHIELELCTAVSASVVPFRDPGLLQIWVNMMRGHTADEARQVIDDTIDALKAAPVSEAEMAKAKNTVETDLWLELSTLDSRAEALGHYETTLGDFSGLFDTARRLAEITADDVTRVARKYLNVDQRTQIVCEPNLGE